MRKKITAIKTLSLIIMNDDDIASVKINNKNITIRERERALKI